MGSLNSAQASAIETGLARGTTRHPVPLAPTGTAGPNAKRAGSRDVTRVLYVLRPGGSGNDGASLSHRRQSFLFLCACVTAMVIRQSCGMVGLRRREGGP